MINAHDVTVSRRGDGHFDVVQLRTRQGSVTTSTTWECRDLVEVFELLAAWGLTVAERCAVLAPVNDQLDAQVLSQAEDGVTDSEPRSDWTRATERQNLGTLI